MFPNLTFRIANAEERMRAILLRDEIYREELGQAPLDEFDQAASHLVVVDHSGAIVAAARLVLPESRPFEFERYVSIAGVTLPGVRVGWLGRLCVSRSYRVLSKRSMVHFGLLKLVYMLADTRDITDLVLYTSVRLMTFYRSVMFMPVGRAFHHPVWDVQQVMHLNIENSIRKYRSSSSRVARLLLGPNPPNFQL